MDILGVSGALGFPVLTQTSSPSLKTPTSFEGSRAGSAFKHVREKVTAASNENSSWGADIHQELQTLQQRILSGREFLPQELLLYQIKAAQFSLRVEMVAKLAESAVATARKLQGNG